MDKSNSGIKAQDSVILFADLQAGIVELTQTNPLARLKTGVRALARLAKLFDIPAVVSGIRGEDGSPVSAIKATGRRTLLLSGVATELAVQLPALTASDLGYNVYVVMDACGGMSERTEQAAVLRMAKAGATTVSVMTLAGELAGDLREPKAQQAIGILYEMAKS